MATKSFHSALRELILSVLAPGQELRLAGLVRHYTDTIMVGYGDICSIYRHGKRGVACVLDEFDNYFRLSELSEDECHDIMSKIHL